MGKKDIIHNSFVNKDVHLYFSIMCSWVISLIWFHPRLMKIYDIIQGTFNQIVFSIFILFIELAWLYGFYNIWTIFFAWFYYRQNKSRGPFVSHVSPKNPAVALLYPTCNDFVEAGAYSCVNQDYPNFTVYILDDSTDTAFQSQVDRFADQFPNKVRVIRRPDRRGFKAGNLNYALSNFATSEPLFAITDADEILPGDFLKRLVPILIEDEQCGFVQANHCCNPNASNLLRASLGVGIDIHWRWYQPLRNKYGFVMLLGHGAVLRRECWTRIGGFPEIVSEDLAYAIRLRDQGWYGRFVEDVMCYEEFPESVRSFRIRHMKWTRGICELLVTEMKRLILSKNIPLIEKLDILFPTMNLPLSTFFFPFTIYANLIIKDIFLHKNYFNYIIYGREFAFSADSLKVVFNIIFGFDLFLMTLLTFIAPILCFILELAPRPLYLVHFLCHSTVLYASLCPLSTIGVLGYLVTRKATFLVTGDRGTFSERQLHSPASPAWSKIKNYFQSFLYQSHPDHSTVKSFEVACGVFLICSSFFSFQISLFGLGLAFILLPIMHHVGWENPIVQRLILLPFSLVSLGLLIHGLALLYLRFCF
jgi:cellulose synthase/poly-beta-1,6-N-acetylglucosamine synthase-like glycosyltransferase